MIWAEAGASFRTTGWSVVSTTAAAGSAIGATGVATSGVEPGRRSRSLSDGPLTTESVVPSSTWHSASGCAPAAAVAAATTMLVKTRNRTTYRI